MTTTKTAATYGTEITATHRGLQVQPADRPGETGWRHHLWDVTLTREGKSITFPYRMGVGHEQTKCGKRKPSTCRLNVYPHQVCDHVGCENAGWKPTPPTLYDALTALKADQTGGETFTDWCGDFGYDTDSRKAMETYLACQESEVRSRGFFGADWSRILDDEDYE